METGRAMRPPSGRALLAGAAAPIALLSAAGPVFVWLSTRRYGIGLSPDSVGYIAAARNIASGVGVVSYDGEPLVAQPPLYPSLLSIGQLALGVDPLAFAPLLNALLFGLTLWLAGVLFRRHLTESPALAVLGVAAVLLAAPLQATAVMAWSEPLFVAIVLLFVLSLDRYLVQLDARSFVRFTAAAALGCLTRYVGVTLILSGVIALLFLARERLVRRAARACVFAVAAAWPVLLWAIRNQAVSGSPAGSRGPAALTLRENLSFAFDSVLAWYMPAAWLESLAVVLTIAATVGLLAAIAVNGRRCLFRTGANRPGALAVFACTYASVLFAASSAAAFDRIGDRLLSPVYIPATMFVLMLLEGLVAPFKARVPCRVADSLLASVVGVWLIVHPLRSSVDAAAARARDGTEGYSSRRWRESALVQHFRREPPAGGRVVYSNAPEALYILAGVRTTLSPARHRYASMDLGTEIGTLRGAWPGEGQAVLVWSDAEAAKREWLFSADDLGAIARMQATARLADGTIYEVSTKPRE
jgi:hypothetical protein